MPLTAAWTVQKAVYADLTADAGLTQLLDGPQIFDAVPRRTRPPYIVFDSIVSFDRSAIGCEIAEHRLTLTTWSTQQGRELLNDINHRLTLRLRGADLQISSATVIDLRVEQIAFRPVQRSGNIASDLQVIIVTQGAT